MYRVSRVLNNNGVIAIDMDNNQEYVLLGKGLGFGKKVSERFEKPEGTSVYRLAEDTDRGSARALAQTVDPQFIEMADAVMQEAESRFGNVDRRVMLPLADHLSFAASRVRNGEQISNPLTDDIRSLFYSEFKAASIIKDLFRERLGLAIDDHEVGYVALHVHSAIEDEKISMAMQTAQAVRECVDMLEQAGLLTEAGAKLLDPSGALESGIPMCPPEGDAGTGMVATNSVAQRTGNVSAGTSVFAMIVLEHDLKKVHPEIDLVTTPDGSLVGMVHCNNCTSDLNAWVGLFREFAESFGMKVDMNELFGTLYRKALEADKDCGGLLAYNYFSGEHLTGFEEGRPLFVRTPDAKLTLANFMRTHLYTALGALKTGLDILFKEEGVQADEVMGHGGLFKTKGVGQSIMAAAMDVPVTVMETAGEGGAWGIALLAAYMKEKKNGESLGDYLNNRVFAGEKGETLAPDPEDVKGFDAFLARYTEGLAIERTAVEHLK